MIRIAKKRGRPKKRGVKKKTVHVSSYKRRSPRPTKKYQSVGYHKRRKPRKKR